MGDEAPMCATLRNGIATIALAAFLGASAGCARNYYGYTEEQWYRLTEAEQAAAKAEYDPAFDAKRGASQSDPIAEDHERLIRRGLGMNPEHAPY
jgi:hypothetical protein